MAADESANGYAVIDRVKSACVSARPPVVSGSLTRLNLFCSPRDAYTGVIMAAPDLKDGKVAIPADAALGAARFGAPAAAADAEPAVPPVIPPPKKRGLLPIPPGGISGPEAIVIVYEQKEPLVIQAPPDYPQEYNCQVGEVRPDKRITRSGNDPELSSASNPRLFEVVSVNEMQAIMQGDVLWTSRQMRSARHGVHGTGNQMQDPQMGNNTFVSAALNGIHLSEALSLRVLGWGTTHGYDAHRPGAPLSGFDIFKIIRSGTYVCKNRTAHTTFFPGDIIGFRLPDVTKNKDGLHPICHDYKSEGRDRFLLQPFRVDPVGTMIRFICILSSTHHAWTLRGFTEHKHGDAAPSKEHYDPRKAIADAVKLMHRPTQDVMVGDAAPIGVGTGWQAVCYFTVFNFMWSINKKLIKDDIRAAAIINVLKHRGVSLADFVERARLELDRQNEPLKAAVRGIGVEAFNAHLAETTGNLPMRCTEDMLFTGRCQLEMMDAANGCGVARCLNTSKPGTDLEMQWV